MKFGNVGTVLEKGGFSGDARELSVSDGTATDADFMGKRELLRDPPGRSGEPGEEGVFLGNPVAHGY